MWGLWIFKYAGVAVCQQSWHIKRPNVKTPYSIVYYMQSPCFFRPKAEGPK